MPLDGPTYPVNLRLGGRRCLVVGGGTVALSKVTGLIEAGAVVHIVAPRVNEELAALVARPDVAVTAEARAYREGEVAGYRLVITATDDPAVNRAVFVDGEGAGVWVNSADDPANCSFTLPAQVRRGDLMVTISTSGRSPALAAWLRRRFSDDLGPEYEALLDLLGGEREALRARGVATEGLDWQRALDSGMLDLIREGRREAARERLRACLSSSSD